MQQCVSSCALLSQRFLILAVAAALHGIGHQNDAEDDHEHDGGQRVDLRADLFAGHGVDGNGQGLHRTAVEVGDHEVVDGVGQADEEGRQDGGADLRQNDLEKGLPGVAAQIQRCLVQPDIQLLEFGAYVKDNVGHVERDMRNEQRGQTHDVVRQPRGLRGKALVGHEQQHQGDAGDDLRVDHRDIGDVGHQQAAIAAHGGNAKAGCRAQHCGDDGRQNGHLNGHPQRMEDGRIREQAAVPLEGKAGEERIALALVEAEHDHVGNGQVHEAEEQDDVDPLHQAQMFCFHQDTPSISSSSKLDVKLMHSSTMIISTKLMAEPTFRL